MSASDGELHIRSAADLLRALRASTLPERAQVVVALAHEPALARMYGAHEGEDVIGELCRQLETERSPEYVALLVDALVAQDEDARVERALVARIDDAPSPVALARMAYRLARSDEPTARRELSTRALARGPYDVALLCARALATRADLDIRESARAAIVPGGRPELAPPVDSETRDTWLEELHGPFAEDARALLAQDASLDPLASAWSKMDADARAWLVSVSPRISLEPRCALLQDALADEDATVVTEAIAVARSIAPGLLTKRLGADRRREVRLAFARSCRVAADVDLVAAFDSEADTDVRVAWVEAVAAHPSDAHLPSLVRWLDADHWSVRAATAAALVRLGDPAAEALKDALPGLSDTARVAAAQALMQLGHHEWLESACIR